MAPDQTQRPAARRWILTFIQTSVTLACLTWLWRKPEIRAGLTDAISVADPFWLLNGLLIAGAVVALGVVRWQLFLRLQGIRITWMENAKLTLIGSFFNLVLIGTVGGDAIKILYLMRRFPHKRSAALVSILMDHLCGLPVVILFYTTFVLSRWEWLAPSGFSTQLAIFAGIYLGVSLLGIILLLLTAAFRLTERTPRFLPWRDHAIKFAQALALFPKHWKITLIGVALSLPIHGLYFGTFHAAAQALQAGVSLVDMFTLMPIVDVITTIPISISGLGLRESLFESFLEQLAGVPSEVGVLISLLGFGFSVFWSLLGGMLFPFYRPISPEGEPESFRQVVQDAREIRS